MKLSDLLTGLASLDPRTGAIEAAGVTSDSRKVKRGDVFVAVPGTKADGLSFAAQAAAAGAAAIVGEGGPPALPRGRGVREGRQRQAGAGAVGRSGFIRASRR